MFNTGKSKNKGAYNSFFHLLQSNCRLLPYPRAIGVAKYVTKHNKLECLYW